MNNKFIPNETFEQYMLKQTRTRKTKKLMFDEQPGLEQRKALLSDHLSTVAAHETMRQTQN